MQHRRDGEEGESEGKTVAQPNGVVIKSSHNLATVYCIASAKVKILADDVIVHVWAFCCCSCCWHVNAQLIAEVPASKHTVTATATTTKCNKLLTSYNWHVAQAAWEVCKNGLRSKQIYFCCISYDHTEIYIEKNKLYSSNLSLENNGRSITCTAFLSILRKKLIDQFFFNNSKFL